MSVVFKTTGICHLCFVILTMYNLMVDDTCVVSNLIVAFFAQEDILAFEELIWDYGCILEKPGS